MTPSRSHARSFGMVLLACGVAVNPARALLGVAGHGAAKDPVADSLYRAGREALARREYRAASAIFTQVETGHATAAVAGDALFWKGYALYVSGDRSRDITTLRGAADVLDTVQTRYPAAAAAWNGADLRARVISAEAVAGDPDARRALRDAAAALQHPLSCQDPALSLNMVALEQLIDRDPEAAHAIIDRAAATSGDCGAQVRRAVLIVVSATPGLSASVLKAELAAADGALHLVQGAIPPVRPLGAILRVTRDSLLSIASIRVLSDGRVLANDTKARRVVLFDSSLAHFTTVIDTTGATSRAYGARGGGLLPFYGDTSIFADIASLALVVLSPEGKVARLAAGPRGPSGAILFLATPSFNALWDGRGGIVTKWALATPAPMVVSVCGAGFLDSNPCPTDGRSDADVIAEAMPGAAHGQPDSMSVARVNLATHTVDTVAWLAVPTLYWGQISVPGTITLRQARNPLPAEDDFTVLADGTIAVVREFDYHIDWYAANGARTSSPKIAHEWVHVTDSMKTAFSDSAHAADSAAVFGAWVADSIAAAKVGRISAQGAIIAPGGRGGRLPPKMPAYVDPSVLPDYMPPFLAAVDSLGARAVVADADNHVWIRVNQPKSGDGGTIYDVVDRAGALVDRVQLPGGTTLMGFGPGVAYLISREGVGYKLARAHIH